MKKDKFSEESLIELGETKSEESLKILLKYVKKREKYVVKEVAYESIEKLCPVAGDKLRAEILSFMNEELNSASKDIGPSYEELLKKHIAIANILAFFKDRDSIEPLLIRYGTHYANIRPLTWKQYTKPIIEAIMKIAGNNKDDAFMKALAEWKCDPGWSEGDVIGGGWKIKIDTKSLNVVFSSLLACTEDLKRLEFFLKNGAFNKNLIKAFSYGYPIANVKRKDVAITPEEKEAYDKVVKNTSKENIANLIKIMLDSTHPVYKSYYKNMGGKDDDPRKFLLDDDPSMQLMGIAMAKGVGYPKGIQHILLDLALFSKEEAVRESALEGVKNAGIENIPFPKLKDLASENIQLIRKKNKNKTIASAIISIGDLRGLEYLQEIFKNANNKTANSIIDGVLTFLDKEKCIIFYDGLLKELCYDKLLHKYKAQYMKRWLDKTSIFRLRLPYGLPREVIEAGGGRLNSIFSGYAKTEVSEKQSVIFKFVFQMSFEIAFCMISRDVDEIKEKIPSMDKFVKKNIKNSYKLDDITTLKNLEKFLLSNFTATENKIQLDQWHDNSRPIHKCMRIAAARCLGIIYSSYKEHRERISKLVEPFREDKSPLIQKALKPIK